MQEKLSTLNENTDDIFTIEEINVDFYQLEINYEIITEGDELDIIDRLDQIIREHGL